MNLEQYESEKLRIETSRIELFKQRTAINSEISISALALQQLETKYLDSLGIKVKDKVTYQGLKYYVCDRKLSCWNNPQYTLTLPTKKGEFSFKKIDPKVAAIEELTIGWGDE
jgi:hypothetical protein